MHAIGIDISSFNAMISNTKVEKHNISQMMEAIREITLKLEDFQKIKNNIAAKEHILAELGKFNYKHFPSPESKWKWSRGEHTVRK